MTYFKINDFGRQKIDFGIGKIMFDGGDHLLITENLGLTEDYVRVKYQDIRFFAVFPKKKPYIKYLCSVLIIADLIYIFIIDFTSIGTFLAIITALVSSTIMIWNFNKSRCVCRIGTDFQEITLPVPNEMKYVESFAQFLRSRAANH